MSSYNTSESGVKCYLCEQERVTPLAQVAVNGDKYRYLGCHSCQLYFVHPRAEMSLDDLDKLNAADWYPFLSDPMETEKVFQLHIPTGFRRLEEIQKFIASGSILDVGCGTANVLIAAKERGWQVEGTEVCKEMANYVQQHYGVEVFCGVLENAPYPPAQFDVVRFSHVLEHLPHPCEALRLTHRLLAENGLLVIEVPNASCFLDKIRNIGHRLLRTGKYACGLMPPQHWFGFTRHSLRLVLEKSGFIVKDLLTCAQGDKIYYPLEAEQIGSFKRRVEVVLDKVGQWGAAGSILVAYAVKGR